MPEESNFLDRTTGFFDKNPILGGLLAATPFGGRMMSALGTLAGIQARKAALAREKALEGQLSEIEGFGLGDDYDTGLAGLWGYKPKGGLRPESARRIGEVEERLLKGSAARALSKARVVDRPAETWMPPTFPDRLVGTPGTPEIWQDIPYSPDRAERGGAVPPMVFSEPGPIETEYPTPPPTLPGQAPQFPLMGAQRFPAAPPGIGPAGRAARATISPAVSAIAPEGPPEPLVTKSATYRRPRDQQEEREALGDEQYERVLRATGFKGGPPDLAAVRENAALRPGAVNSAEELETLLKGLEEQYASLPPEQQAQMAGRLQTARGAVGIAKKNPKALIRSIGTVEAFQTSLEKSLHQGKQMAFRREVFDNHKVEFQTTLSRIDQMIKNSNFSGLVDEFNSAQRLSGDMRKQIDEMLADPTQAGLVEGMKRDYLALIGRLQHLQKLMQERRNEPTPVPSTGQGPPSARPGTAPPPPKADPLGIR
jgi:hypothetical protein